MKEITACLTFDGNCGEAMKAGRKESEKITWKKLLQIMSMSRDGFITGPNDGVEKPLGDGGERLHECVYDLARAPRPRRRQGR